MPAARRAPKPPPKPSPDISKPALRTPAHSTGGAAKRLIGAALEVPGDMLARQARFLELLLGSAAPAHGAPSPGGTLNPFGAFEEVFDARVAQSLARLGMPSAEEVRGLVEQVRLLRQELRAQTARRRKG